jgi:hypothetical protein
VTEDNRIPEIREVMRLWDRPHNLDRRTALERIRAILDSAPPAPRVFFPGDTVPAGTALMLEDGSLLEVDTGDERWDINDGVAVELLGIPTREEWQAAVDRAVNERPGLCDGCDRTDAIVGASDDGRGQFCPRCLPGANEINPATSERAIPEPTEGQNRG